MADGSIVFRTDLDNKELERELQSTCKRIESLNRRISQMQAEKMPLVEQAKQLGAELDRARLKLEEMRQSANGTYSAEAIADQKTRVSGLQSEWSRVMTSVEGYDLRIQNANIALASEEERAGGLQQQLAKAGKNSEKMTRAVKKADSSMAMFSKRLAGVVRSALVFTVITQALSKFRTWMGNVVKTNDEAVASIARLKGALLTMVQPLVNVIIPAFTAFVNILTKIITVIAALVAKLFGMSFSGAKDAAKNLNKEAAAIDGVGSAAEKAKKQLAAFDEINQLTSEDAAGGGGGSGGAIEPSFDFDTINSIYDSLPSWLKDLASDIKIKIKDLIFDWDKGSILKNQDPWIIALSGILGAVIGTMFGGLSGGVIGLLLGLAVGLVGCTLLDKTGNPEKYKKSRRLFLRG